MKKFIYLAAAALSISATAFAQQTKEEAMPFLKGPYAYEILREGKASMNGNPISDTRTETKYDDNNNIISIITTNNGQPMMELVDYVYGDRTLSYVTNSYMNGQKTSTIKTSNQYADDFYRNIAVSEIVMDMLGNTSNQKLEWNYDDQGRVTGMKQYADGQLQSEEKNYVWTPNSCEYEIITYAPIASTQKVSKKFQDDHYVQNVLEIREMDMNGFKTEIKNEYTYDNDGNLTSSKSYTNGDLTSEWKDYNWGDKKSSHTEIMYMNGAPYMVTEVTQYYK